MRYRWGPDAGRRRLASLAVATVLAIGLGASPAAVRTALAAGPLRIDAEATYTLDPDAGRVHVAVQFRATSLKPNTPTTIYFYRDLAFAIQPDATAIRASDGTGNLSITTRKRKFFVQAEVHLRADLYFQQSTTFTIRYDLVGAAPRSDSPIRVGQAFATFGVWAWGDVGRSSVEVRTPEGFGSEIDGDAMQIRNAASGQTLVAEPADPDTFYTIVSAENRSAYGMTRISLEGDVEIVVRAWPEDDAWDATVSRTLEAGLPELLELIGLDWPVEHDLEVRERYTPSLEGYAGVFFTDAQRIDVSEDLDPLVIIHEASHAWFNDSLFSERWIYEGLAEEYAWRVQTALGEDLDRPERPDLDDPGFAPLSSWSFPEVIRDQETDDRERFGYEAAFWMIHQVVISVGVERMREAFAGAEQNRTAYPGVGEPETVPTRDGWQRFLDLVQSIDRPDQIDLEKALYDLVLVGDDATDLGTRAEVRDEYRLLLIAGDGWLPPWYVRQPMGEWRFGAATERIVEAEAVLALRDQVDAAAMAQGLQPDDALRLAYEGTGEGFDAATTIGEDQIDALAALDGASTKLAVQPDLVATIGLLGEAPPQTPYDAARAAFERGELESAVTSAAAAVAIITGAAAVGQQRLLIAVGVAIVVLLLLVVAVLAARRRGRRRRALALAAVAPAAAPMRAAWTAPSTTEPYATLAADPAAHSPPPAANPPDLEGGRTPGESPADR